MNLENYISELLEKGTSPADIAHELADALNAAEKTYKEKQAEVSKSKERESTMGGLIDLIIAAIDTNTFDFKVAAAAVSLTLMQEHQDWGREESDEIFNTIYATLTETKPVLEWEVSDEATPWNIPQLNKSKKVEGGADRSASFSINTDPEAIKKFLKSLGV